MAHNEPAAGPSFEAARVSLLHEGLNKLLGPLELRIMEICWAQSESTVADVHHALDGPKLLAYTTVMTTMQRLAAKGLLQSKRVERRDVYHPAVTRTELESQLVQTVIEGLLADFPEVTIREALQRLDNGDQTRMRYILATIERQLAQRDPEPPTEPEP